MSKHTPGPWIACGLESRSPYVCADDGKKWDNAEICNLFNDVTPIDSVSGQWLEPIPNAVANARLIAAAPELLQALLHVMPHVGTNYSGQQRHDILEPVRAAIAKARGE